MPEVMAKCKWRGQNELRDPDHFVGADDMRRFGAARRMPACDFLKIALDAG